MSEAERNPPRSSRQAADEASKVMKGDKTTTQVPFSLPSGPHAVVCAVKNPEKSGAGLSRERAGVKGAWWISAASEHHAQDRPPPGAGEAGAVGEPGQQAGVERREEELLWSGRNCPARISVFYISYCQRPISPARGPCPCDKGAAADDSPF